MRHHLDINRRHKRLPLFILTGVLLLCLPILSTRALGAGLLVADGGFGGVLEIEEHEVRTTINNGIAVTHVTQVFRNTENRQVEALYTFPVPKQASVSNFSMWINGKEMVGEVLEKERARQIYNSYKRQRRPKDPGLLEQVDFKTFEMRIFPINPGAQQKVQITYYQELDIDHDQATYVYPLATVSHGNMDTRTTGRFAFQLEVKSAIPIAAIESPSHPGDFVMVHNTDTYKLASLEQKGGSLASDIVINYDLRRPKSGIDLVTSRANGEDGFFYMTITAGEELAEADIGMDYVFLLDISGSMANDAKLAISRQSLFAFIDELDDRDRFEVMTFNVQPNTLFRALRSSDAESKAAARAFLDSQAAKGGTILAPALTTAYRYGDPDRPLCVVILSDGMTEQKERQELVNLIAQRPSYARVFCIGIGNEVNRPLLEQMAEDSGGLAAFISRGDNFKRQAKAFRRKLMRPAATELNLKFDGADVYDVVPVKLPNLYHGAPVRVYGRYRGQGQAPVSLQGQIQGRTLEQTVSLGFPAVDTENPEIERMWAMKRIDHLLKEVRRGGDRNPAIDEVIRLGEAFSIVTEYTSFLVLENDGEYQRWKIERRNLTRLGRDRAAQAKRQEQLNALRDKAMSDIGPQPPTMNKPLAMNAPATSPNSQPKMQPTADPARNNHSREQSRDFNFRGGFGSGPVGPLFVGIAYFITRRRKKR
jgi:Ca-activated chloride channel family protein